MSLLSLPDLLGMMIMMAVLFRLRQHRSDRSVDLWMLGLGFILAEAVAVAFYRGGSRLWHTTMHAVALDCYVLAAVTFGWAAGQGLLPKARKLPLFSLPAVPLFLLTTAYGYELKTPAFYLGVTSASLLAGAIFIAWQLRGRPRLLATLMLLHVLEWLPMLVFAMRQELRWVVYYGLTCMYLQVAIGFRKRMRGGGIGGMLIVAGFVVLALTFFVHPLTRGLATLDSVVEQVWDMQKFLVILGMVVVLLEEETESRRAEALHDALTGLPNRRLLDDRLGQAIARADRTALSVGLYLIDLNGFKQINDRLGHNVGDQVLCRVAQRLRQSVRSSDTLARYGGDEFCVVVGDLANEAAFEIVARELRRAIESVEPPAQWGRRLTGAVGYAIYPRDGGDALALSDLADARMYDQKRLSAAEMVPVQTASLPAVPGQVAPI